MTGSTLYIRRAISGFKYALEEDAVASMCYEEAMASYRRRQVSLIRKQARRRDDAYLRRRIAHHRGEGLDANTCRLILAEREARRIGSSIGTAFASIEARELGEVSVQPAQKQKGGRL